MYFLALLLLWCSVIVPLPAQATPLPEASEENTVALYFFWSRHCPHCQEARPFVEALPLHYPWLRLHSYDLIDHPEHARRYAEMAGALGQAANAVPGFIFCGQMQTGFDNADGKGRDLERALIACWQRQQPTVSTTVTLPGWGQVDYRDYSLPVFTVIVAALDAFNPCAFFVLLFLLSLLSHQTERRRFWVVGLIFVGFSGLIYFTFMAAWLNLFLWLGPLRRISLIAGLIALGIGVLNTKDFFWFQQGPSLSIPESKKPQLYQRMRAIVQAGRWPGMIAATVVLAIAVNSYELLCTAGLPMVFTRVLTLHPLDTVTYYTYLAFYNLVYVMPLLAIVVLYGVTFSGRKLTEFQGRALKLLSGLMMLGLGAILTIAPERLTQIEWSLGIVFGAVVLALLILFYERSNATPS